MSLGEPETKEKKIAVKRKKEEKEEEKEEGGSRQSTLSEGWGSGYGG